MSGTPERAKDEPIRTIEAATSYLDGLINRERKTDYAYRRLDLRPIEAMLDALGRPDARLSIIHVAGSKGKGSTCLFTESLLLALGERVGTFTSPHLERWTERFRVAGAPIEDAALVAAVEKIRPVVEALRAGPVETRPSFFDATTAVALLLFAEARVDRVLLEVGLGGRLDSTNAVSPVLTCITSIELEHVDKLGDTEAKIAAEKAGILKPGVRGVIGPLRDEAMVVVRARAQEVGCPLSVWGEAYHGDRAAGDPQGLRFHAGDGFSVDCGMATPGAAARTNAAIAVACVRALEVHTDSEIARACREGLAACRLPGRSERLAADPRVLVDAAHTARSGQALALLLRELAEPGVELVLSVSADKALDAFLAPLLALDRVARVTTTCADADRSLPASELAARVTALLPTSSPVEVVAIEDAAVALRAARDGLAKNRLLVATGSVYLAGIARRVLGQCSDVAREESGLRVEVGMAREEDVAACPGIEARAARLFPPEVLDPDHDYQTFDEAEFGEARHEGRLLVARSSEGQVLGFALLERMDDHAHLEELDVDPDFGRQGIGRRLVEAALEWARARGLPRVTLSTFRDLPWNAPFYASAGFRVLPESAWSEALRARREHEIEDGLDPALRVLMACDLTGA